MINDTPKRDSDPNDAWDRSASQPAVRTPTTREKFSVLLPALLAFLGMIAMLVIFLILAAMRS